MAKAPAQRPPTAKDVARLAEVSEATVSYVVSGRRGGGLRISPTTQQRVLDAMTELNYVPNAAARTLRRGRTRTFRLLIVRRDERFLIDPFLSEVISGVVDGAAQAGYALLLEVLAPTDATAAASPTFAERRVDGTILVDANPASPFIDAAHRSGGACVVLPTRPHDQAAGWVYADFDIGAGLAVDHLVALGHRRIAHLAGYASLSEDDRRLGFERSMRRAGIEVDERLIVATGNQRGHGYDSTGRLLDAGVDYSAVFTVNDMTALGAIDCLHDRGRSVPGDVSVVGFDDVEAARHCSPALTTVHLPAYDMGRAAVELAVDSLVASSTPPTGRTFPVELVVRGSTAPPRDGIATT